jgi:hypothetical protein
MRVRDRDRPLENPRFLQPRRPSHLAVAIEREPRAEDRIRIRLAPRMNHSHPGAHRPFADDELPAARDECRVSDLDAGDIGDRVHPTRRAVDRQAKLVRALLRLRISRGRGAEHEHHHPDDQTHE